MPDQTEMKVDPVVSEDTEDKKDEVPVNKEEKDVEPKSVEEPDELTAEEKVLKESLELMATVVMEPATTKEQEGVQKNALTGMAAEIKTSASSMTSVPLPLKFLRPQYDPLKAFFETMPVGDNKLFLANILSIMAMTMSIEGTRESLKYRLKGTQSELGNWGHEYVRLISGEIGQEYVIRMEGDQNTDDLTGLVDDIIPFKIKHSAEYEAVDLLLEVDQLEKLVDYYTKDNFDRINKYMLRESDYIADDEDKAKMFGLAFDSYLKFEASADALRAAIKMGGSAENKEKIIQCFEATDDVVMKKQLGYILSVQRIVISDFEDDDDLMEIIGNVNLNGHFMDLARDLDVQEAKSPEDIYKSHLSEGARPGGTGVDSARQNLASSFVNAFVNCGFGKDLLITPEGSDWLYKNKQHGMMSASASLGMIMLWDVDSGFSTVDRYSFSAQNFIKAGSLMATGMLSSGVSSELDAAYALLAEHVESDDPEMKISAIFGLGLAYAGSAREDVLEILVQQMMEEGASMEIVSLTCLALGMVYVGTANNDISGSIIEAFLDRSETDLKDPMARLMCLGLGLLYLGQGDKIETTMAAVEAIENPIKQYLALTIQSCAYVGTSNVLEIQKMVKICSQKLEKDEKKEGEEEDTEDTPPPLVEASTTESSSSSPPEEEEKKDSTEDAAEQALKIKGMHQEVALLGIAMISGGEAIGAQMALRLIDHVLQYGEMNLRRVVPLALGLLSVSDPQLSVMDTLSKLTHDQDQQVSQNAILGLGFLGAGTNNSRLADILRQLATYYAREPNHLFLVRISQGMLHLGKGLMTLDPYHSDRQLMSRVSMAGLLCVLHTSLDLTNTILGKRHYLLFCLVLSIRPRMLVTLDEDGTSIPVSVRVGQGVDTVGAAGNPRTITGFQTHTTPVLLSAGERAELATDEYIPMTSVLEGFVILKVNPDSKDAKLKQAEKESASKSKKK